MSDSYSPNRLKNEISPYLLQHAGNPVDWYPWGEEAFEKARENGKGELAEWLVSALKAGQTAGGDKRGRQSSALLVLRKNGGYAGSSDRYVDLRVEDHENPIVELERLLQKHRRFYGPPIRMREAGPQGN